MSESSDFRPWISRDQAFSISSKWGTPVYLYSEAILRDQARKVVHFPNAFGLQGRYAMKANPNRHLLQIVREEGLWIDASSVHEVERAVRAGFKPEEISLSTQELSNGFADWVKNGLEVNCCSLRQLDTFGQAFPGNSVGLRFNPGLGSGGTGKTNVGGPSSSFGIWHQDREKVAEILRRHRLTAHRIHSHIGSGSDPEVWKRVAGLTLHLVRDFPTVKRVNLGGGYKVARIEGEIATDLNRIGRPVADSFRRFAEETGRELFLEVEPGTFIVAKAGALLCSVQDMTQTGGEGYRFLKLDGGMTEILRPSLYAAQHPIHIFPASGECSDQREDYVVVGHCCESGDLLTPSAEDPEKLAPRSLLRTRIGDLCLIGGTGAYCSAMATTGYNSFPAAAEVLIREDGEPELIRRRQTLQQILANEL